MSKVILPLNNFQDIYTDPQFHFVIHQFEWNVDMKKIEESLSKDLSKLIRLEENGTLYKVTGITKDDKNRTQIEISEIKAIA